MNSSIIVEDHTWFARVILNRPQYGNAYDDCTAVELTSVIEKLSLRQDICAVVMEGKGTHFCTGADLNWMRKSHELSQEDNINEMNVIKQMYQTLLSLPVPLIVVATGKIRGGGVGLVACGDIVIASEKTTFALTEAKWGLIPGIITPILEARIGQSRFLELALTAREISTKEAREFGLIHFSVADEKLNESLHWVLGLLKENSRQSLMTIKKSIVSIYNEESFKKLQTLSAKMRASEDFKMRAKKLKK